MMVQLPQAIPNYDAFSSVIAEPIILCDEEGNATGVAEKLDTHNARTPRHIAFSCYVFNDRRELLVTRRAHTKKVWPGVWTNTVCGHPAPGETYDEAIARRLQYELGMIITDLTLVLPEYKYTTPAFSGIIENEICPVFFARAISTPKLNPTEVDAYKWVSWADYGVQLAADTDNVFSWWAKDQFMLLTKGNEISAFI